MYHSIVCLVFLMVATTGQAAGKSRVESRGEAGRRCGDLPKVQEGPGGFTSGDDQ